jgi:hypothetical protein
MNFTFTLALFTAFMLAGAAPTPIERNAERLARGLPPLSPANLQRRAGGSPVQGTLSSSRV